MYPGESSHTDVARGKKLRSWEVVLFLFQRSERNSSWFQWSWVTEGSQPNREMQFEMHITT